VHVEVACFNFLVRTLKWRLVDSGTCKFVSLIQREGLENALYGKLVSNRLSYLRVTSATASAKSSFSVSFRSTSARLCSLLMIMTSNGQVAHQGHTTKKVVF
jgi:hypothetical protein